MFKFGYMLFGRYIDVIKGVRFAGYFSKPEGVREQKVGEHWTSIIRAHIRSENSTIIGRSCDLLV
jgi:hypothetical protein